jgi:hypothetical protein
MRILFGAVISTHPFSPGMAWNWMHHVVGLRQLGHEVCYVEEVRPGWCVDAQGRPCAYAQSVQRRRFRETLERFDLLTQGCQVYDQGEATFGLSREEVTRKAREADLLVNVSGHVTAEFILDSVRRRAYVDQDPVYTQLWHAEYGKDLGFTRHDVFFSVGLNIGTPHSPIPDCGVPWYPYLPPVVLDYWPWRFDPSCTHFTTVASWTGYSDLCYQGQWYRSKYDEFSRFAPLPRQTGQPFEVLLKCFRTGDEGVRLLQENGWSVREAGGIADLDSYQHYLARSRAEIGIAKGAYVLGRSGWFSDRAAHYLASGRPVLAQSTGFERCLPTGRGLLAFSTLEEAAGGVEQINCEYEAHCRAAREFAAEYLDYRKVFSRMLDACTG